MLFGNWCFWVVLENNKNHKFGINKPKEHIHLKLFVATWTPNSLIHELSKPKIVKTLKTKFKHTITSVTFQ